MQRHVYRRSITKVQVVVDNIYTLHAFFLKYSLKRVIKFLRAITPRGLDTLSNICTKDQRENRFFKFYSQRLEDTVTLGFVLSKHQYQYRDGILAR